MLGLRTRSPHAFVLALVLAIGCSAKDKAESAAKTSQAAVDCADPNLSQSDRTYCDSCHDDNACVACYQSGDDKSSACQTYCADPNSLGTMCPSDQKCNDANGKCDPSKCWCMADMGSGGMGQGGASSSSGSSTSGAGGDPSGAGGDTGAGGDPTSGAGGDTGAGGDPSSGAGGDTGAGGDPGSGAGGADMSSSSGDPGCDNCFVHAPPRRHRRR